MNDILFFDTETTGFVRKNIPHSDPAQARCCQLYGLLTTDAGEIIDEMNVIIKPTNWVIPDRVAEIHGITTARAHAEGIPIEVALGKFKPMVERAGLLVAHNFDFDTQIMEIESYNYPAFQWMPGEHFCTMKASTNICKIPSARGGYKWPKLQEIHKHLFGHEFESAHDASADGRATMRVYFELKKRAVDSVGASDIGG